ncbi:hypothetical protein F0562_012301 [Nyssa sinensis]|uniref:Uncharacterized protein n=1 Tax=Nyssa sinensis TaxID=561372 RepID=A0A5J4ZV98_9ASTE|nr:hypothetical protein F0562_012301 [Nyssa sinensis]
MGGLAVLQPQDCLKNPITRKTLFYDSMKSRRNPNPKSAKLNRRKRSPTRLNDKRNDDNKSRHTVVANFPAKNLVMGQVKILKRGDELKETTATKDRASEVHEKAKAEDLDDIVLYSTDRLGPEPEMVPKQVRPTDFYAGSAFIESPPPMYRVLSTGGCVALAYCKPIV